MDQMLEQFLSSKRPTVNPSMNASSNLADTPEFQAAVQEFIKRNGYEPATDSDFEADGGVLSIMDEMQSRPYMEDQILQKLDPR